MKLKRLLIPLIAVVALLGSVVVGNVFGWWQVSGTPLKQEIGTSTADIKGSSTLEQVSTAFSIPQADLYRILGLPDDVAFSSQLKSLESYIEVSVVRTKVAEYLQGGTAP